jgi:hypothetical protein
LGDIIHNARTSLDLMASEMARDNNKSHKGVHFPFAASKEELAGMIKRKKFHLCGHEAVEILKGLKPYKGGNAKLRELHDLDIQDKHQELLPSPLSRVQMRINPRTLTVRKGDPKKFCYVFPKDSLFSGRELVEVCKELVEMCEGILEAFA